MYSNKPSSRGNDHLTTPQLRPGTSAEANEGNHPLSGENYVLPLKDLFLIIRKRLWIILLVVTLLAGGAVGVSLIQTPLYEGSSRILVGQSPGSSENPIGVYDLQQLTQTMTEAINSRAIAEPTMQELGLAMSPDEFLGNLSVEQVKSTQLVQINYRDPNPEIARQIADTTADVFSKQVTQLGANANPITATVWERAKVSDEPASPNLTVNIGVALIVGLIVGLVLAFLLDYLDDSWRSPEEIEEIAGVPTLGVIPTNVEDKAKGRRSDKSA